MPPKGRTKGLKTTASNKKRGTKASPSTAAAKTKTKEGDEVYKVSGWGAPYIDKSDPRSSIWVPVHWEGFGPEGDTDEPWSDEWNDVDGKWTDTPLKDAWIKLRRQYDDLVASLAVPAPVPAPAPASTVATPMTILPSSQIDSEPTLGSRILFIDLEWHGLAGGPISQMACVSLDGVLQLNNFIFHRPLHPDWMSQVAKSRVELSKWDDPRKSTSFFIAFQDLLKRIEKDSIIFFYGSTDRAAFTWAISNQIETPRERTRIKALLDEKMPAFRTITRWMNQLAQEFGINERLGWSATKQGRLGELFNGIFNVIAQDVDLKTWRPIDRTTELTRSLTRANANGNGMRMVYDVKRSYRKPDAVVPIFHDAATDATALKHLVVTYTLAAMIKSTTIRKEVSSADRLFLPDLNLMAFAAGKVIEVTDQHSSDLRPPESLAIFLYDHYMAKLALTKGGKSSPYLNADYQNLQSRSPVNLHLEREMQAAHEAFVSRVSPQKQKVPSAGVSGSSRSTITATTTSSSSSSSTSTSSRSGRLAPRSLRDAFDDTTSAATTKITTTTSALTTETQRSIMEAKIKQQEAAWRLCRDEPIWYLKEKGGSGTFTVHCKHCLSVLAHQMTWREGHPRFKPDVQEIPLSMAMGIQRFIFCKTCRKYEDDESDEHHPYIQPNELIDNDPIAEEQIESDHDYHESNEYKYDSDDALHDDVNSFATIAAPVTLSDFRRPESPVPVRIYDREFTDTHDWQLALTPIHARRTRQHIHVFHAVAAFLARESTEFEISVQLYGNDENNESIEAAESATAPTRSSTSEIHQRGSRATGQALMLMLLVLNIHD